MSTELILVQYRTVTSVEDKIVAVRALTKLAHVHRWALDALYYILNDENDSSIRLEIMSFLRAKHPRSAVRVLAKGMFDPDPYVRAQAALGVASYEDARLIAGSLGPLLNALSDPATRSPAERAVRTITGKSPDKITVSERERVRLDEGAHTIWPEHFANLPADEEGTAG